MADVLINGQSYSWAQITLSIGQNEIIGITKIGYTDNQEMQDNYGQGNKVVSRAYGNVKCEGSLTLDMVELQALQDLSPTGRIQDIKEFDVLVAFLPEDGDIVKHKLEKCRFMNNGRDISQGAMVVETEINLIIASINWRA
jgi:hypothetical protein